MNKPIQLCNETAIRRIKVGNKKEKLPVSAKNINAYLICPREINENNFLNLTSDKQD